MEKPVIDDEDIANRIIANIEKMINLIKEKLDKQGEFGRFRITKWGSIDQYNNYGIFEAFKQKLEALESKLIDRTDFQQIKIKLKSDEISKCIPVLKAQLTDIEAFYNKQESNLKRDTLENRNTIHERKNMLNNITFGLIPKTHKEQIINLLRETIEDLEVLNNTNNTNKKLGGGKPRSKRSRKNKNKKSKNTRRKSIRRRR